MFTDFYFDSPHAGYLLLLLGIIIFFIKILDNYRKTSINTYISSTHQGLLLLPRSPLLQLIKNGLIGLTWIFACLALMGPKGNLQYQSVQGQPSSLPQRVPHEVILMPDTSASMGVADMPNGLTRLARAKEIMREIISQLDGQDVSLYAFTSELTPLVPATTDYIFTRLVINELELNEGDVGGTNFTNAIETLMKTVLTPPTTKLFTVILLSDGGDNQVEELKGTAREEAVKKIISIIPNAEELHLRLFTIGIGSEKGTTVPNVTWQGGNVTSKLEPELLKRLAQAERGEYLSASEMNSWDLLTPLFAKMNQDSRYETSKTTARQVVAAQESDMIFDLYFQIPLGLALLCLLLQRLIPDTVEQRL